MFNKTSSTGMAVFVLAAIMGFSAILIGCSLDLAGQPGVVPGSDPAEDEGDDGPPPPMIDDWVLPMVVSITGEQADMGVAAAWGFAYGVNVVNEQGGIRDLPVNITVRDAASSDSQVATEIGSVAADALVSLGSPTQELYKAGQHAFYAAGMPVIGAATDEENRAAYEPFAISCIADSGSGAVSAVNSWVKAERFSTVYVVYSSTFSERSESAINALLQGGKAIIGEYMHGNEGLDAAGVAEKAYELQADAYYIDLNGEDTLRIIKQLRFLAGDNAGKLKILCGPSAADKDLIESAKEGEMIGIRVWTILDPTRDAEKRKAFDEAFARNVTDDMYHSIAVDYYQSALMLKQAIDTLSLTGSPDALAEERATLARYLYDSDVFTTDQGDFINVEGNKETAAALYKITEKGFE